MSGINIFQELFPTIRKVDWTPSTIRKHLFGDGDQPIEKLCQLMMESDGEYSSLLIADQILTAFENLDEDGRVAFFKMLNEDYDLDVSALQDMTNRYLEAPSVSALKNLTNAAESRRKELFRRLNMAPSGTIRLVKMREALLRLAREDKSISKMDADFRHLFSSWFNRGFLLMQPVDWTTPAHILEKVIAYEAVHEICNWDELRSRLEPDDRHCYAFFHPAMQDEPLVFVEVALTEKIPQNISDILQPDRQQLDPADASCAIFYSISNCHSGLSGVSFGNLLIKQVAMNLTHLFPHLKTFSTISPVPGFTNWLKQVAEKEPDVADLFENLGESRELLEQNLETDNRRDTLMQLAAQYFHEPKNHRQEPIDPVARFHLKNGAKLERLNLLADPSKKAFQQSLGLMVNYVYDLSKVEENHENYMQNKMITCAPVIKKLANASKKTK